MKIVKYILPVVVMLFFACNALAVELNTGDFKAVTVGAGYSEAGGDLPTVIGLIIKVILGFLGVILIVLIIYAGFLWMTAGGESKQVDKATAIIKNAIIGLVLILLAYAIADFVITKIQTEIIK